MSCIISVHVAQASEPAEARAELLDLLSMVPDISETSPYEDLRLPEFPPVWIVDYRAAETAVGVPTPSDWAALKSLDVTGFSAWSSAVSRFRRDPLKIDYLSSQALLARSAPLLAPQLAAESQGSLAVLGINWFDVEQALVIGHGQFAPPASNQKDYVPAELVAFSLRQDRRQESGLASTLPVLGFTSMQMDGVEVWHRLPDGDSREDLSIEPDVLKTRWPDPFGVTSGSAARIAVLGDKILGSPYWGTFTLMLKSARGEIQSLAQAPDFRAVVEAVTNDSGSLGPVVQLVFINRHIIRPDIVAIRTIGPYSSMEQRQSFIKRILDPQGGWGKLPAYRLIGLADQQEDDHEVVVLALVYDDLATASAAAQIVADRIRSFSFPRSGHRWFEEPGVEVSHLIYNASNQSRSVALIVVRYTPTPEPDRGLQRGKLFQDLYLDTLAGAAYFLIVN